MRRGRGAVLMWLVALVVVFASICQGEEKGKKHTEDQQTFVATTICGSCHPRQFNSYMQSAHSRGEGQEAVRRNACEQCHGDGADHVLNHGGRGIAIFGFSEKDDAKEKSARCLVCHFRSPDLKMWDMGVHDHNDVSCDNCHTMHPASPHREREQEICFTCHRRVHVEANKRSHHPILEGKVGCSSCHQPHGTMTPGLVRATSAQALCYSCHADKRGPAVWIHPPVEENCQNCHRPHGSIHANLLVDRVPQLCRNCHDWSRYPGSPYAGTAGSSSGKCAQNHPAIHGSSAPSGGAERLSR